MDQRADGSPSVDATEPVECDSLFSEHIEMATVTFIVGLCGAGKTWLAERMPGTKFDEGFLKDVDQHAALINALRSGEGCVVVEIAYCLEEDRRSIVRELAREVPTAEIEWLCIENDLDKANKNCRERTNKGDPDGHVRINRWVSPRYTYPVGATVLPMWTRQIPPESHQSKPLGLG